MTTVRKEEIEMLLRIARKTYNTDVEFERDLEKIKDSYLTGIYPIYDKANITCMPLPFETEFKKLFSKRNEKINLDSEDISDEEKRARLQEHCDNCWKRKEGCKGDRPSQKGGKDQDGNELPICPVYSQNYGNFNHFGNVIAAMAHLIHYFKNHNLCGIPFTELGFSDVEPEKKDAQQERLLNLMHIAFLHDLGKSVQDYRHPAQGGGFLAEPKATVQNRFNKIFDIYKNTLFSPQNSIFSSNTIIWYSIAVSAHDVFGTNNTGENSLLKLGMVIEEIKSLYGYEEENWQKIKDAVVDLFLLNIADGIASINNPTGKENKWAKQQWQRKRPGNKEIITWINDFLNGSDAQPSGETPESEIHQPFFYSGEYYKADLRRAFEIIKVDDSVKKAGELSEKYAVERFYRLFRQSLGMSMSEYYGKLKPSERDSFPFKSINDRLRDHAVIFPIIRQILRAEFGDGYREDIGKAIQWDYALIFFKHLATHAIIRVHEDIKGKAGTDTKWIFNQTRSATMKKEEYEGNGTTEEKAKNKKIFFDTTYAETFINNYLTVIAKVFKEIHKKSTKDVIRNVEFSDMNERLKDEAQRKDKCDRICGFQGPFREAVELSWLIDNIMLY